MENKRLIICTIGGIIAGLICSAGGLLSGNISEFSFFAIVPTFFNRLMLGFFIGISNLKLNFLFHGIVIGLLVSLITSIKMLHLDSFLASINFVPRHCASAIYKLSATETTSQLFIKIVPRHA